MKIIKRKGNYCVVALQKGEVLLVEHMLTKGIEEFAEIKGEIKGELSLKKVVPRQPLILLVENLREKRCKHVRFARVDRGAKGLDFARPKPWPRLRVALLHADVSPVHVLGGFENALVYQDEIAIPNYSISGSTGFIIPKREITKYLQSLPPLRDSGEIGTIWIDSVGWVNTPDEFSAKITNYDPTDEEPPSYYDRGRGEHVSFNRSVFRVEFDRGSRVVKKITHLFSGEDCEIITYAVKPFVRYIEVGKRLPNIDIGRKK